VKKKCIYTTFSETFLVFLVTLVVFLGVKFGFRKSCLCKRNDKYEVCIRYYQTIAYNDIGLKSIVRGPMKSSDLKDIIRKLNPNCMEHNIFYNCT